MEKYFIVTDKSPLWHDYLRYKENAAVVRQHVKVFMEEQGIEASQYYETAKTLYVVPTEKDIENFGKVLAKNISNGLRPFKKNSRMAKAWVNSLKENNIKIFHKPNVGFYFKELCGRFSYRLLSVNGNVYCSMSMDHDFETPEGMENIKASEFFKIIEDYNATT